MPESKLKKIELIKAGKLVGTITTTSDLYIGNSVVFHIGNSVVFHIAPSILKQEYGKTYESIVVPIGYKCINDDGVDYTVRRFLDVTKKSKRQIKLLKEYYSRA